MLPPDSTAIGALLSAASCTVKPVLAMQTADELFEGFGLVDDERASSVEFVETLIDESRLCVHAESLRMLFSKLDTDRTGLLSRDTLLAVSTLSLALSSFG